jgi:hypothetical protein
MAWTFSDIYSPEVVVRLRDLGHVLRLVVLTGRHLGTTVRAQAPRFYPDDPLAREPVPLPVAGIEPRALSAMLEAINNSVKTRGQHHPGPGVIPAQGCQHAWRGDGR